MHADTLSSRLYTVAYAIDMANCGDDGNTKMLAMRLRNIAMRLRNEADACIGVGYEVDYFTYGEDTGLAKRYGTIGGMGTSHDERVRIEKIIQDIIGGN